MGRLVELWDARIAAVIPDGEDPAAAWAQVTGGRADFLVASPSTAVLLDEHRTGTPELATHLPWTKVVQSATDVEQWVSDYNDAF